ncbi:MAG: hypothetical protein K0R66_1211 [Gammaproteobacteria bacterium]|jgi:hypothetical protein|nr:hypothetical protein [Gammaproteobacteria bacterium]
MPKTYSVLKRVYLPDGSLVDADDQSAFAAWRKKTGKFYLAMDVETFESSMLQFDANPNPEELEQTQKLKDYLLQHLNSKKKTEAVLKGLEAFLTKPKLVHVAAQFLLEQITSRGMKGSKARPMLQSCLSYLQENDASLLIEQDISDFFEQVSKHKGNERLELFKGLYGFYYPVILNFKTPILFKFHILLIDEIHDFGFIAEYAVQHGSNINAVESRHLGTLLHYFLANEASGQSLAIIELFERFREKGLAQFNYKIQDIEGKTPLLLAAKCRLPKVLKKLLELQGKGVDVGINIPDNEGRSPLLIAAALGQPGSVKALLKAGADPKATDNKGRGFEYYANAPQEEIEAILRSIQIEPGRALSSRKSWLTYDEGFVLSQESTDSQKRVLLSHENKDLLQKIRDEALVHGDKELSHYVNYVLESWLKDSDTKQTVLEDCLAGRSKVLALVEPFKAVSASPSSYASPFMAVTAAQSTSPMLASPATTAIAGAGMLGPITTAAPEIMLSLLAILLLATIMRHFNKPRVRRAEPRDVINLEQ